MKPKACKQCIFYQFRGSTKNADGTHYIEDGNCRRYPHVLLDAKTPTIWRQPTVIGQHYHSDLEDWCGEFKEAS